MGTPPRPWAACSNATVPSPGSAVVSDGPVLGRMKFCSYGNSWRNFSKLQFLFSFQMRGIRWSLCLLDQGLYLFLFQHKRQGQELCLKHRLTQWPVWVFSGGAEPLSTFSSRPFWRGWQGLWQQLGGSTSERVSDGTRHIGGPVAQIPSSVWHWSPSEICLGWLVGWCFHQLLPKLSLCSFSDC